MILLAALALASCRQEEELEFAPVGEVGQEEVAFKIGSVATRSAAEADAQVNTLTTVKVGESTLTLDETVTSLDYVYDTPGTRGTPAFTENVATLYGTFNAVAYDPAAGSTVKLDDASFPFNSSTKYWAHDYGRADIWSKAPYMFYMRMPADVPGVTKDNGQPVLTYGNDGSISFSYTSPATATEQKDILFTSTTLNDKEENGKTITFYHALTGVKFANYFNNDTSNPNNKTETLIREVTISGLKNTGSCKVTPSAGEGEGKSKAASEWTDVDGNASYKQTYDEAFATYGSTYALDSKLNHTADKHNLNDANGSLTFWFIPQTLTSATKVKVKFDIRVNGSITFSDQELEVSLGDLLYKTTVDEETGTETTVYDHRTWHAGELHTFTLRPEKVGVKIEDEMASATVKQKVRFTNTGNVDQYVRVYMIGNWLGDRQIGENKYNGYDTVLMGYESKESTVERARWNDKDFTYSGSTKVYEKWSSPDHPEGYDYTPYGDFEGLPGMGTTTAVRNWVRHDKFFYYTELIGPGKDLPSTDPLFTKYTLTTTSPEFWIAGNDGVRRPAKNVHLELDIAVQAIAVPYDKDGNAIPYDQAWAAALGLSDVSGLNDL